MARLRKHKLKINPEKVHFLQREIIYLGHIISGSGIKPNPESVKSVENFPAPDSKKKIQQFLRKVGYFRRRASFPIFEEKIMSTS